MGYLQTIYGDDPLGAILAVFTDAMGLWGYAIMAFTIVLMLYIRTESTEIPLAVGMVLGVTMIALLPPQVHQVGYLFLVLAIVGGLYKVIK